MNRKLAVLAAALVLCAVAHGQTSASSSTTTPTTSSNENTLDSARRELKELPATERSRDVLAKPSSLGSAGLPTLTLPGGDPGNSANRPGPNSPPSATWLQDALNQTDAEAATHRRATDPSLARDRDRTGGYKPAEVPNPFGQYLQQWISPRDLELLRAGQDNKNSGTSSGPDQATGAKPWEPLPATTATTSATPNRPFDLSPTTSGAGRDVSPIMQVTRNPYIEDADPTPPAPGLNSLLQPQLIPGQPLPDRSRGLAPLGSTSSVAPPGPRQPAPVKPAATPAESRPRPPTAPIVDDRKYFPQLRRF